MPVTPSFRPPQIDLATILKQPTPVIDLRVSAFQESTRNFTKAVAIYKNRALTNISDAGSTHVAETRRLAEKIKASEQEIDLCKLKEIQLLADIEREQEEQKASELSIASLRRRLASLEQRYDEVSSEVEQYHASTANLTRERKHDRMILKEHAAGVSPELDALQEALSCIIEGVESDKLLIRYFKLDESDPEREMSFVVDVSAPVYRVLTTSPILSNLSTLVENLNRCRDIYRFVIHMRLSFQQHVASR